MNFKEKYLVFLVMVSFITIGLYYSYALFITKQLQENVVAIKTVDNIISVTTFDGKNNYTIGANSNNTIDLIIKNNSSSSFYYEVFMKKNIPGVKVSSNELTKGIINGNEEKKINVNISNTTSNDTTISFVVKSSLNDDIMKDIGYSYINLNNNFDHSGANSPNINNLNLIPVSYKAISETEGYWYKTDENNNNDVWYDYDNGIWANAALVSSNSYKKYYNASIGTEIKANDILGYYVWIPRFKYIIMNNSGYTNFEKLYNVVFENENSSTGTVTCYDKISNTNDSHLYSEVCQDTQYERIYDNLSTYTHPAFYDKKGFWVSKFLVGKGNDNEKTVPGIQIVKKDIYEAITFSENIIKNRSHLLTNMEYSSLLILTNSQYGKSGNENFFADNNYTFKRVYINNYLNNITGCSSDYSIYTQKFNISTSKECIAYNNLNNYSHIVNGINYKIGEVGPGASTTGTIYGVYDMATISGEIVAAIAQDNDNKIDIHAKYMDNYSYNSYIGKIASSSSMHNLFRYKLGDGIKENIRSFSDNGMWQGGLLEHQTSSGVFIRGGNGDIKNASIYTTSVVGFEQQAPFRASIS